MQEREKEKDLQPNGVEIKKGTGTKALVAMSGGVDSSVAAYFALEQGFQAIGATMVLYEDSRDLPCIREGVTDAEKVARRLGIPYHVFYLQKDFTREVIDKFIRDYEAGLTPNPCVDCNRTIKFGKLLDKAAALDCSYLVTGHYARTEKNPRTGRVYLKKAVDLAKDQSYMLYGLGQKELAKALFPLGSMTKDETRRIADRQGFANAFKHDSQDICFVPDGRYADFIRAYTGKVYPPGDFVDEEGRKRGRHQGIIAYTVGQRRGLGLALTHPLYVKKKDAGKNQIVLAENERLFSRECEVADVNWILFDRPPGRLNLKVKIRYGKAESPALVIPQEGGGAKVIFDEPVRAITPGQAAVFYDGEYVVGGGTIVG